MRGTLGRGHWPRNDGLCCPGAVPGRLGAAGDAPRFPASSGLAAPIPVVALFCGGEGAGVPMALQGNRLWENAPKAEDTAPTVCIGSGPAARRFSVYHLIAQRCHRFEIPRVTGAATGKERGGGWQSHPFALTLFVLTWRRNRPIPASGPAVARKGRTAGKPEPLLI